MIKANSLLYAVYVCLLVSILCGALLYFSSLYTMLNTFYNTREEMYIQNQSAMNYGLSQGDTENTILNDENGIVSSAEIKSFGLLNVIVVKSIFKKDTIASAQLIGHYASDQTALYLTNFSNGLSYAGNVTLIGDKKLPSKFIDEKYINNSLGNLKASGKIELSTNVLPEISSDFKKMFVAETTTRVLLKDIEMIKDSIYFNSFLNKAINVQLTSPLLQNKIIKGNFILHAKDSIVITANDVLEDVIVKAPVVRISKGFKGNIQVFADKKIMLEENVTLSYPSVLCVYNTSAEKSQLVINEDSAVYGAVVLFGNPIHSLDDNSVLLKEKTKIVGVVYCTGKLMIEGSVYGSVYTNRIFSQTASANYENCIINGNIDVTKRPDYFISIPLFKNKNEPYGVFKKVL